MKIFYYDPGIQNFKLEELLLGQKATTHYPSGMSEMFLCFFQKNRFSILAKKNQILYLSLSKRVSILVQNVTFVHQKFLRLLFV